ncbi:MAG: hypothetical protein JSR88_08620 [Proteobacteria bacterium]|nr:hypothetical protein [Pseudomonadota bacterium]
MRPISLIAFVAGSAIAAPAYAHGEQILVSFYAQAIAVAAVLLSIRLVSALRAYWVAGLFGCFAGVVVSWFATGNIPYMENQVLITVVGIALPIAFTVLCVFAARRYAKPQRV